MNWLSTGLSTASLLVSCYALALALNVRAELRVATTIAAKAEDKADHVALQMHASTPAKLQAELAAVVDAIEIDRLALRKQLGKIWGKLGREAVLEEERRGGPARTGDDDYDAMIAMQAAYTNGSN